MYVIVVYIVWRNSNKLYYNTIFNHIITDIDFEVFFPVSNM